MEYKNLPDLRGWAALKAVVDRGSLSAATAALNVGQPAVTKRLRALEECYGLPLVERVGGRMRLTQAGEKVYLLAVQTLDRQLALRQELQNLARGQSTLRLESTIAIGEHFLPQLLLRFAERFDQYKIENRLVYSRQMQSNLANRVSDLALMERAPDHPDLLVQKWIDDELWLVCGPGHPLANEESVPVDRLGELTYVLREKGSSPRTDLEESLARAGIGELDVVLEVGSTDTLVEVLLPGNHASFLPRFAVARAVTEGRLHRLHVPGFHILHTLWIARHRDNIDNPAADAFISVIRGIKSPI